MLRGNIVKYAIAGAFDTLAIEGWLYSSKCCSTGVVSALVLSRPLVRRAVPVYRKLVQVALFSLLTGATRVCVCVLVFCLLSTKAAESKLAMMEANEEQLKQRQERLVVEKKEEDRLIQIMLNKFKVCYHVARGMMYH